MFRPRRLPYVLAILLIMVVAQQSPAFSACASDSTPTRTLGTPTGGYWTGQVTGGLPSTIPPESLAKAGAVGSLPYSFSWSGWDGNPSHGIGTNYMTPVKDQGNCGSCWAFAAIGDMEAQYQINRGNPNTGIDLSEQNSLSCTGCDPSEWPGKDCTGAGGCGGNYLGDTLRFLKNSGTPDEACNPYTATDPAHGATCGTNRCSDHLARTYRITDWTWISTDTSNIKSFLYNHGPIIVGMLVYQDFPWDDANFWQYYYYGHDPTACDRPEGCGHLVVIVGWNDDGGGYWIVRNSWGTDGGDVNDYGGGSHGGYFYMTMDPYYGFFGVYQEAAVISNVTPPPTVVKSRTIFGDEFSGARVKIQWRESGHRRTQTLVTPFSLNLEEGLYKFTAPSTVRVGGVQYRFAHWKDETNTIISGSRTLVYDVQSGKMFYAVYGPRQYRLTVEVRNQTTGARVPGATVEVTQIDLSHYTAVTNSRGRAVIGGIFAGQPFTLKITVNGILRYEATLTITRNTSYRAYIT